MRLCVGDDWAEDHHDIEVMDEAGQVLARTRGTRDFRGPVQRILVRNTGITSSSVRSSKDAQSTQAMPFSLAHPQHRKHSVSAADDRHRDSACERPSPGTEVSALYESPSPIQAEATPGGMA